MKFVKVEEEKIDADLIRKRNHSRLQADLIRFAESGIAVAAVEYAPGAYKSVSTAQSAIYTSLKRLNMPHIRCKCVNKQLYLINTLLCGEDEGGDGQ